jgi:PhoPQ-activated pathogenicity-related protein
VRPGEAIDDFVVTGYSKRGWTTWLTGAVDTRVKAIIPGVIDLLNMDESMQHHYGFYSGEFAPEVGDYQEFELIQNSFVEANQELGRIVDPYRYLYNSNLTDIPKLLLNSTGDEFFVPDSGQYYLNDLPGTAYVRYIPNTGHGLNSSAGDSTYTFFDAYLNDRTLPEFSWTAEQDGSIRVQTVTAPTTVRLWQATNLVERDFRRGYNPGINWTSTVLTDQGGGVYIGDVAVPGTGARAFMVELTFPSAIPGVPYVFTTEVRVKSNLEITPWPFYMPSNEMALALAASPGAATSSSPGTSVPLAASEDLNALALGVALSFTSSTFEIDSAPDSAVASSESPDVAETDDPAELMFAELSWLDDDADEDGEAAAESDFDLALDTLGDALAN